MSEELMVESFRIAGIAVRTCNQEAQGVKDIGALWEQFFSEDVRGKIADKMAEDIYAVYSDYEGDYMQPYTCTIGFKVTDSFVLPEGMVEVRVPKQLHQVFHAHGKLPDAVGEEWMKIWGLDINRAYQADFEVYGEKAANPENGEVDIYIGLS